MERNEMIVENPALVNHDQSSRTFFLTDQRIRVESMEAPPLFILANDKVLARFLMLVASLKYFGYPNKVYVIPFDDNIALIRNVCDSLGFEVYTTELEAVQSFSRLVYDRDHPANPYPRCLGNLHKMVFLTYPGEAVYLDSDIVMTTTPDIFTRVMAPPPQSGRVSIGYINTSPTGVYEDVEAAKPFLARSHLLCAGIMSKSAGTLPIEQVRAHMSEENITTYHQVRRRGGHVDQPVWNYLIDTGLMDGVDLLSSNQASRVTSPSSKGLSFSETGALSAGGRPVLLFHMAGPLLKVSGGCKFFWQGMLWEGMQILRDAGVPQWQDMLAATDALR